MMEEPTKIFNPKGGVNIPIAQFTVMITPNKIGSIPALSPIGTKIGARIKIKDEPSRNIPPIKNNRLINKKIISVLEEILDTKSTTSAAKPSVVMTQEKIAAEPMIIIIWAVILTESTNITYKSL